MHYDALIVGAGPVGLSLATLLGHAGHRVAVVERHRSLYGLPRAIRFDGEAMRLFQELGILAAIEHDLVRLDEYVWYGADGDAIVAIDTSEPAPSGWGMSYLFWQPTLESALQDAALGCPSVDIQRPWTAEEVREHPDHVEVVVRAGEESRTLTARYLVGADGANSIVRRSCGIELEEFGFRERWLVVDVRPHDMSRWTSPPAAAQRCDPERPTVLVRNGASHRRWEFMLLPGEPSEDFQDPARAWELLAPYISPDEGTLVRQAVYEFTGTLARTLRRGRVVLAGDAAHTMPPFMGEGLCSGLRDAKNLAWRLDLLLRDFAPDSLLDAYATERRPHTKALIEVSIQMGKVSCTIDREAAAARDVAFRSGDVPPPPPIPGLLDGTLQPPPRPGGVAGRLAVQGLVRTRDGRCGRFDDVVGPGFSVVSLRDDPRSVLGGERLGFLEALGAHVVTLDPEAPAALADEDGALSSWMAESGIAAFVDRPDGYAFGAVERLEDLPALVDQLQGHLTGKVVAHA